MNYKFFAFRILLFCCLVNFLIACSKRIDVTVDSNSSITYFNGGMHDKLGKITKTLDGGYLYCGFTGGDTSNADAFLMKVDANGTQEWFKTYGGNYYDEFKSVIACSDGGYLAVGTTNSIGKGFNDKTFTQNDFVVKTDAIGNIQWMKSYINSRSRLESAVELPNSEYATVGYYYSANDGNQNIVVLKLGSKGELLVNRQFANFDSIPPAFNRRSWNEYPNYVTLSSDGNLIIAGTMDKSNYVVEVQNHVTFLMKLKSDIPKTMDLFYSYADYVRGMSYWNTIKPFKVPFVKVIEVNDGYYIGTYFELPNSKMAIQLLKTNFTGAVTWEKKYVGLGNAMLYDFIINSDGSLMLTGMSTDKEMNFEFSEAFASSKIILIKTDPSGNEIFTKYYGSDLNTSMAKRIFQNGNNGWDLAGFTSLTNNGLDKMMLFKVDKNGEILSSK